MKRRYNHETNQWDVVLSEDAYYRLMYELESLRQHLSRQLQAPRSLGPYEVPNPNPNLVPGFPAEFKVCYLNTITMNGIMKGVN